MACTPIPIPPTPPRSCSNSEDGCTGDSTGRSSAQSVLGARQRRKIDPSPCTSSRVGSHRLRCIACASFLRPPSSLPPPRQPSLLRASSLGSRSPRRSQKSQTETPSSSGRAVALCRRFRPHVAAFSGTFSFALGPLTEMICAPHTENTAYKKVHTSNTPRKEAIPPRGIPPHTEKIWAPSTEILPAPFSFAWRRVQLRFGAGGALSLWRVPLAATTARPAGRGGSPVSSSLGDGRTCEFPFGGR